MTITETAAEPERPRLALFWGATLTALVIGFVATLGGATVKPLLDVPAFVDHVFGAPATSGGGTGGGTAVDAEACGGVEASLSQAVCDYFAAEGGGVLRFTDAGGATVKEATLGGSVVVGGSGRIAGDEATVVDGDTTILLTVVERFDDGTDPTATWTRASITTPTAEPEPEPVQPGGTSSLANAISTALGTADVWYYDERDQPTSEPVAGGSVAVEEVGRWAVGDEIPVTAGDAHFTLRVFLARAGDATYFTLN